MESLEKLTQLFLKFPGIGSRQARRFAYFVLDTDRNFVNDLLKAIESARESAGMCERCNRLFTATGGGEKSLCSVCGDSTRDKHTVLVVEKNTDVEAIEKTSHYRGTYFIIGGTLPFIDQKSIVRQRIKALYELITAEPEITEVILGCSYTAEGEHTSAYIKKILEPVQKKRTLNISNLGRGISTGAEIEYLDADTFEHALKNRD